MFWARSVINFYILTLSKTETQLLYSKVGQFKNPKHLKIAYK